MLLRKIKIKLYYEKLSILVYFKNTKIAHSNYLKTYFFKNNHKKKCKLYIHI